MSSAVSTIIITYNSGAYLQKCLQGLVDPVYIVDNGSESTQYLDNLPANCSVEIVGYNSGYCAANNRGVSHCWEKSDYILFLNPDVFLHPEWIQHAISFMDNPTNGKVGIVSGPLLGYDIEEGKPSERIDSLGIYRSWYGRWFDDKQGILTKAITMPSAPYAPTAICGALMFCRKDALQQVLLSGNQIFDEKYFMYKEDIDLSLRLKRFGWQLVIDPKLKAYHCRGWSKNRKKMPKQLRIRSSKNDLKLSAKYAPLFLLPSLIKYLFVKYVEQ